MDHGNRTIEVYTSQTEDVVEIIRNTGCYYVKLDFIARKYGIVSDVFLNAYRWYAGHAGAYVPKPEEAESAVWSFLDQRYLEVHRGSRIMKLTVPVDEAVFFRMSDWNRILNMRYLGETAADDAKFAASLARQGIEDESEICLKPYYPQLKRQLTASWENLFRYDKAFKQGGELPFADIQAGLWCIRSEWLEEVY